MSNLEQATVAPDRAKRALLVAMLAAAAILACAGTARAQDESAPVSAKGKGIAGGGLLGAEVALLTEALLGVQPTWAYLVGGVGGAGVGAFGGYYAERAESAKPALYLLAGGMALVIPTAVAVLSVTAYQPPADYTEDQAPEAEEPDAEPPQPESGDDEFGMRGGGRSGKHAEYLHIHRPFRVPPLVSLAAGSLSVGVPALELRDAFTQRELFEYGLNQTTEVRLELFGAAF